MTNEIVNIETFDFSALFFELEQREKEMQPRVAYTWKKYRKEFYGTRTFQIVITKTKYDTFDVTVEYYKQDCWLEFTCECAYNQTEAEKIALELFEELS